MTNVAGYGLRVFDGTYKPSEWTGWMEVPREMAIREVVSDWCSGWCDERSSLWPKSFRWNLVVNFFFILFYFKAELVLILKREGDKKEMGQF